MKAQQPPSVSISGSCLCWRHVRVPNFDGTNRIEKRLLLTLDGTNKAIDADFGMEILCMVLGKVEYEGDNNDQLVCVRRGQDRIGIRKISFNQHLNSIALMGPTYNPNFDDSAEQTWNPLHCPSDKLNIYFHPGSSSQYSECVIRSATVYNSVDGSSSIMTVLDICHTSLAYGLPQDHPSTKGRFIIRSLLGEVRKGYVLLQENEDIYNFNIHADFEVAVKVSRHSPLPDQLITTEEFLSSPCEDILIPAVARDRVIPTATQQLRTDPLYVRENPAVEIEMISLICNLENLDENTCNRNVQGRPLLRGHKNITSIIGVYGDGNNVYTLMPFYNRKDLWELLDSQIPFNRFPEADAREIMAQVISATSFLHRHGIAHLDLSVENFMLHRLNNGTYEFVMIDFGQAVWHQLDEDGCKAPLPARPIATAPGKHSYYCPETYCPVEVLEDGSIRLTRQAKPYDGCAVDVWQIGILMIFLVCSGPPFIYTPHNRIEQRVDGQFQTTPYNNSILSWLETVGRDRTTDSWLPVKIPLPTPIAPEALSHGRSRQRMGYYRWGRMRDLVSPSCLDFILEALQTDAALRGTLVQRNCSDSRTNLQLHAWLTDATFPIDSCSPPAPAASTAVPAADAVATTAASILHADIAVAAVVGAASYCNPTSDMQKASPTNISDEHPPPGLGTTPPGLGMLTPPGLGMLTPPGLGMLTPPGQAPPATAAMGATQCEGDSSPSSPLGPPPGLY